MVSSFFLFLGPRCCYVSSFDLLYLYKSRDSLVVIIYYVFSSYKLIVINKIKMILFGPRQENQSVLLYVYD